MHDPRLDPRLVRRRVEHAVGGAVVAAPHDVHDESLGHVADRPRARHLGARGDEVARQADGQHALVLARHPRGRRVVPPADVLPLPVAALVARGEEHEDPADPVGELVRRQRRDLLKARRERLAQRLGRQRARRLVELEVRAPAVAREAHARRRREVVPDAVGVPGERDAPHRVGDVVIEAREEAEAVLAGQVPPPVARRPGDGDRACLAAQRLALVDGDVEAALGELVGGGQPGDAAAEDGDRRLRAAPPPRGRPRRRLGHRGGREAGCHDARVAQQPPARESLLSHARECGMSGCSARRPARALQQGGVEPRGLAAGGAEEVALGEADVEAQ